MVVQRVIGGEAVFRRVVGRRWSSEEWSGGGGPQRSDWGGGGPPRSVRWQVVLQSVVGVCVCVVVLKGVIGGKVVLQRVFGGRWSSKVWLGGKWSSKE